MSNKAFVSAILTLILLSLFLISGCGDDKNASDPDSQKPADTTNGANMNSDAPDTTNSQKQPPSDQTDTGKSDDNKGNKDASASDDSKGSTSGKTPDKNGSDQGNKGTGGGKSPQTADNPESIAVLVNKQYALPDNYKPKDLVYPDVPFTFTEKIEKRMMRKEAADALELLFAAAEKDDIYLVGVSAYRSHETQKALFARYVKKDGEEKAKMYSAVPGHSEHETGLAIDVTGSDGKCAAEDCFADTKEAEWLAGHAAEYGFIVRYPKGKDAITGYQYEPWHLRYVGTDISKEIASKGLTLEQYYDAVPVSN